MHFCKVDQMIFLFKLVQTIALNTALAELMGVTAHLAIIAITFLAV